MNSKGKKIKKTNSDWKTYLKNLGKKTAKPRKIVTNKNIHGFVNSFTNI